LNPVTKWVIGDLILDDVGWSDQVIANRKGKDFNVSMSMTSVKQDSLLLSTTKDGADHEWTLTHSSASICM
jgi:hypothetical protein